MPPASHTPHRVRRVVLAATGLAAVTALAGCGGSQSAATSLNEQAPVTLTWWTGQADTAETILEGLAADFHTLHPNVTIKVSSGAPTTDDLLQKLSAGFAGDSYPDISYAYGSWAGELEASGRTLDITDKVSDPTVKWSDFSSAARQTAKPTGGKTIGFPAVVDDIALFYNKTVFDAAGLAYPTADWTWDDFRTAAKKLTDPSTNTYGYAYSVSGGEETTWQFWPHLWQRGGDILSADSKKATFNSQAGVDALTFLRGMAIDDKSVYLDQTDTNASRLFASNRVGMITAPPWELYDLKVAGTNYGVTLMPGYNGNHETISGPDLWALFDHKDPNRAYWSYELAKWLTDPARDLKVNVGYGNLPLRPVEMDTPEFRDQAQSQPGFDVLAKNIVNAVKVRPTVQGYAPLSEAIGTAISSVLQGQGDPRQALDAAAATGDQALAG